MAEILKVKINGEWKGIPAIKGDKGEKGDPGIPGPAGSYIAGTGIDITGNVISCTASGNVSSVNGQTGVVVLDGEDISATVDDEIDTVEGHLQTISDTISGYGDVVTHNASEFQPAGDYATTDEIPTATSDLSNDSGFITNTVDSLTNYTKTSELAAVATSGIYNDLINTPTIPVVPTNVSAFTNDAGYITANYHDSSKQDIITDLATIRSDAATGAGLATQVATNTENIEKLTVAKFPNAVIVGTPHITGGQVSNFSDANYLQFPFVDISRGQPFDIYFSFTTAGDITTQQNILDAHFGIALAIQNGKGIMALSSNGTSWDIGTATGTNALEPNTTYYAKYSWTGSAYSAALSKNEEEYVPDMNLNSTLSPYKTTIFIGGSPNIFGAGSAHPFKGTINFNDARVVVGGKVVWQGMADVGLATRANVSLNNLDTVGEERFAKKQDVTDNTLVTTSKTVVGAINELNGKVNNISASKFPNAVIIGDLTINHGQTTGFSQTSYLALPFVFNTQNKGFEFHYAFKTNATDITTPQNLFGSKFCVASYVSGGKLTVRVSSNGTGWDALDIETTLAVQANTTYYIKLESNLLSYTVSASTDGVTYNQIGYKVTTAQPKSGDVYIGIGNNKNNPFLGMIDLNKWWLKIAGETIWEGMGESGLSTRADISLSNLDEDGEARFTAKQNKLTAGTNITIDEATNTISATGGSDGETIKNQNASSSIEKTSDWVGTLQEAIDQNVRALHPDWKISITDDTSGGDSVYTKTEVDRLIKNNSSGRNIGDIFYTKRTDSGISGAVECNGGTYNTTDYTGADSIGELLAGNKLDYISIAEYASEISTKGWCDKIGWDGGTEFRVPTLTPHIIQKNNIPVIGNGMTLGLTYGIKDNVALWSNTAGEIYGMGNDANINVPVGTTRTTGTTDGSRLIGVTTDSTKSGIIADTTDAAQLRVMFQLFTGTTEEGLATCSEVLADVSELKYDYVVDFQRPTEENGYTWYRKYKSGWVEQGGEVVQPVSGTADVSIVFPIRMMDRHYTFHASCNYSGSDADLYGQSRLSYSETECVIKMTGPNYGTDKQYAYWTVSGMAA